MLSETKIDTRTRGVICPIQDERHMWLPCSVAPTLAQSLTLWYCDCIWLHFIVPPTSVDAVTHRRVYTLDQNFLCFDVDVTLELENRLCRVTPRLGLMLMTIYYEQIAAYAAGALGDLSDSLDAGLPLHSYVEL